VNASPLGGDLTKLALLAAGLESTRPTPSQFVVSLGSGLAGFAGGIPSSLAVAVSWTLSGAAANHLSAAS